MKLTTIITWLLLQNIYQAQSLNFQSYTAADGLSQNIIYSAGNKIRFTTGTHIHKEAKYHGKIQPCGSKVEY